MTKECDCLTWCGDDPWLKDGRAEPCAYRKKREEDERIDDERHAGMVKLCAQYGVKSVYDLIYAMQGRIDRLEHEFDRAFLDWCADRMVYVYGADPRVDYVLKLRKMAGSRT